MKKRLGTLALYIGIVFMTTANIPLCVDIPPPICEDADCDNGDPGDKCGDWEINIGTQQDPCCKRNGQYSWEIWTEDGSTCPPSIEWCGCPGGNCRNGGGGTPSCNPL